MLTKKKMTKMLSNKFRDSILKTVKFQKLDREKKIT